MLTQYLDKSIETLQELIELTVRDIEDIKKAEHDLVFDRAKIKEELVKNFENQKSVIDNEVVKISSASPNVELQKLLSEEQTIKLSSLREYLEELREKNRHYATLVIAVSEFYTSLVSRIFPKEPSVYNNKKSCKYPNSTRHSTLLHVSG